MCCRIAVLFNGSFLLNMHYRQIWEQYYGPIPLDELGRPYEIHHIDGNRKNNNINNLKCITVEEHYNIHLQQNDYYAAFLIGQRLNRNVNGLNELKQLMSIAKKGQPSNFTGKNHSKESKHKMSESAKKRGLSKERLKKMALARVGKKRKPFSDEHRANLSESLKGKPNPNKGKIYERTKCPHCDVVGASHQMKRYHFDNCKNKVGKPKSL